MLSVNEFLSTVRTTFAPLSLGLDVKKYTSSPKRHESGTPTVDGCSLSSRWKVAFWNSGW